MREMIEINIPCVKHGLEIVVSEDTHKYCEECIVERIQKNIEGYSLETIARWIHKNAAITNDWWKVYRYAQLYTIEEVDEVIFNDEFYSPILKEKKKRLQDLEEGLYRLDDYNKEEF